MSVSSPSIARTLRRVAARRRRRRVSSWLGVALGSVLADEGDVDVQLSWAFDHAHLAPADACGSTIDIDARLEVEVVIVLADRQRDREWQTVVSDLQDAGAGQSVCGVAGDFCGSPGIDVVRVRAGLWS